MDFIAAERQREREATDTDGSSNLWGRPINTRDQTPNPSPYLTQNTQPISAAASGGGGDRHPGTPKPGGASFADSPLIANVKPHETYKIHVATKSKRIRDTPGIVRRVVEDVARLYYATGERPSLHLQGITGKGAWEEFTVAIGPLKDSPLALAMYNVDVFMKAFIQGGVYFPQSGSSLDETRRLARINVALEAQRQKEGMELYDWVKDYWGGCYDFQDDDHLRDLYQEFKDLKVGEGYEKGNYCFKPYVRSCSVSEDGTTFFFEPDIHVITHGYTTRDDGTAISFKYNETEKPYVQIVRDAINSNSDLAYDLDIIHVACCAYALVQSLPRDRVYNLDNIAPVPEDKEKMELLSPLQYGIVHYCVNCERDHLSGGCQPRWAEIHPEEVVGTPPSMERSVAFDLPTMAAADLGRCLRADWSRTLVENFDETLVLGVALHDRPHLLAKDYSRSQASAALDRNPHKSRLVGPLKPFASYLKLVDYYKRGTEKSRAAYKEKPGAFISGWRQNVFDAKEALLELAKKKGDSVTEAIVRTRLDVDGVYDKHTRSVAERRLLRAAADAAAAPPVDLSKLAELRTLKGHSGKVHCCVRIL